jgi:hypothetical protein
MSKPIYECETQEEEIEAMQELINSGTAWKLEGSIGRRAMELIRSGHCILGEQGHYDAYGNYVPARSQVQPGTKGSVEYQKEMLSKEE